MWGVLIVNVCGVLHGITVKIAYSCAPQCRVVKQDIRPSRSETPRVNSVIPAVFGTNYAYTSAVDSVNMALNS